MAWNDTPLGKAIDRFVVQPVQRDFKFWSAMPSAVSNFVQDKKQEVIDNAKTTVENASPGVSVDSMLSDLIKGFETVFASSAKSSLELQKKYADQANALTEKWNKKAMDFEAQQAELNRIFQSNSARDAMQFSADEAQKNREWQEHMSGTAFQRAMADMQAAGLNPILAYTQGGASTPAGSAGSGYQASGSSAGGHSASAAAADAASGKKADMDYLSVIFNSAGSLLSAVGSMLK